ncbi:MAG: SH3 domain-containing protein, partial [Bacillota bacterium]
NVETPSEFVRDWSSLGSTITPSFATPAAGGAYGVVECKGLSGANHTAKSYVDGKVHQLPDWTHFGRLKMLTAAAPAPAPDPKPGTAGVPIFAVCTGTSVNVRSGPGTAHDIVTTAHTRDKFTAIPAPNGWYYITGFVDGKPSTGYISGKYLNGV